MKRLAVLGCVIAALLTLSFAVAAAEATINWDALKKTKTSLVQKAGGTYAYPAYPDEVDRLDGRTVAVEGFMIPLDVDQKNARFLLSAQPPSCPYCLPGGPEQLIEVQAAKPLMFTYDPIVLSGRLELLRTAPDGMFFRLTDARLK